MKKTILIYGLVGAIFLGGMFFLFPHSEGENTDYSMGEVIGYLSMLVGLTTVVLGVRSISNNLKPNPFSFFTAFKSGMGIAIIGSIGYAIGWMIYFNMVGDNGMMDGYFEQQIAGIENSTVLTDLEKTDEIESAIKFKDLYLNNSLVMFGMTLLEILPIGLLVSLISAFVFKRKP